MEAIKIVFHDPAGIPGVFRTRIQGSLMEFEAGKPFDLEAGEAARLLHPESGNAGFSRVVADLAAEAAALRAGDRLAVECACGTAFRVAAAFASDDPGAPPKPTPCPACGSPSHSAPEPGPAETAGETQGGGATAPGATAEGDGPMGSAGAAEGEQDAGGGRRRRRDG